MSKICQNCNSILSDNHKFCTKCGAKIVDKIEEKTVVSDNKNNLNTKESTGTYYKIGAFLILIGIALFFGLNKNNNVSPQEEIIKKKSEQQPIIKKENNISPQEDIEVTKYTTLNKNEIILLDKNFNYEYTNIKIKIVKNSSLNKDFKIKTYYPSASFKNINKDIRLFSYKLAFVTQEKIIKQLNSYGYESIDEGIEESKRDDLNDILKPTVYIRIEVVNEPIFKVTESFILDAISNNSNSNSNSNESSKYKVSENIDNKTKKMSVVESLECNGLKVKLMSKDKNTYYANEDTVLLSNGNSIKLQNVNIGELHRNFKCKEINGKSQLVITATAGNSWSGFLAIDLDTLKYKEIDYETQLKVGLIEEPVIETINITVKNTTYEVPKYTSEFINDKIFDKKFKQLLGPDYDTFHWNLSVTGPIKDLNQHYVGSGIARHSGGSEEAIFTINKLTGDISVAILTTDYKNNHIKNIKYYGIITYPIKEWAEKLE